MALDVPNETAPPPHLEQATLFSSHIDAWIAGIGGDGVTSGCAVTNHTSGLTATIAAGNVRIGGSNVTVTAGTVTAANADGSRKRIDLVSVNSSGTKAITTGTWDANNVPILPDIPSVSAPLAAMVIPAGATTVSANEFTDMRVILHSLQNHPGTTLTDGAGTTVMVLNTAGVSLDLRNGALRLAAAPNNIIQNSAGTTVITLGTSDPIITLTGATIRTGTVNVDLQSSPGTRVMRIENTGISLIPRLGINQSVDSSARIAVTENAVISGSFVLNRFILASSANSNQAGQNLRGFGIEGTHDLVDYTGGNIAYFHIDANLAMSGASAYRLIDSYTGLVVKPSCSAIGPIFTNYRGIWLPAPNMPSSAQATGTATVLDIEAWNMSDFATGVGIRLRSPTGAATLRTIHATGTAPSIHEPALTVGGTVSPTAGFSVDVLGNPLRVATGNSRLVGKITVGADAAAATSADIDMQSTIGAFLPSRLTDTQRDALTPVDGMMLYNSTRQRMQARENAKWRSLSADIGDYDTGTVTVAAGQYLLQYQELILSGTEELTVEGTGEVLIYDLPSAAGGLDSRGN